MLKLKVYRNKGKELVRFTTPGTYVNGENFAEAAARGLFEHIKTASSRDKFYLATAIAVMIALKGKYNAQLSYGRLGDDGYAAWVEVEFCGETYIIDPVEFRDVAVPEGELNKLLDSKKSQAEWSCNYKEVARHSVVISIAEAMSAAETSKDVIPMIAAVRVLSRQH